MVFRRLDCIGVGKVRVEFGSGCGIRKKQKIHSQNVTAPGPLAFKNSVDSMASGYNFRIAANFLPGGEMHQASCKQPRLKALKRLETK